MHFTVRSIAKFSNARYNDNAVLIGKVTQPLKFLKIIKNYIVNCYTYYIDVLNSQKHSGILFKDIHNSSDIS